MVTVNFSKLAQSVRDEYHFAWSIVAMGTALRIAGNFVSQAFAVILVVLQQDFEGLITLIVLAQVFPQHHQRAAVPRRRLGGRPLWCETFSIGGSHSVRRRHGASGHHRQRTCIAVVLE